MRLKKASHALFVKFVYQNRHWSAAVLAPRLWVVSCRLTVGTVSGQVALTKTCPRRRQERSFADTFELKGLSPFLQELDKSINDETEHDGSLDATIPN